MNRDDFLRALRKYCRKNGLTFEVNRRHGKGSHYWIKVNAKSTTAPKGDYSSDKGPRRYVCLQLGIDPAAF